MDWRLVHIWTTAFGLLLGVPLTLRAQRMSIPTEDPPGHVHLDSLGAPQDLGDDKATPTVPPPSRPIRVSYNVLGEGDPDTVITLPPLEQELFEHGGSYLYEPLDVVGQVCNLPGRSGPEVGRWPTCPTPGVTDPVLRLPENWREPQPFSLPYDFLGSHPIVWHPRLTWFGEPGYQWEPRLVGYGSYGLFGVVYEQNDDRRDGIGHQLIVDIDLALTGTDRAHVEFRPLGKDNTGGSFWQLSDPVGYIDNSTGVPQRWWIEGELQSLFGRLFDDPRVQLDVNVTAGKFPLVLQNFLLMNDELTGIIVGKNTITKTPLSNLNVEVFYGFDEVDAFTARSSELAGIEMTADYQHAFLEFTYAHLFDKHDSGYDTDYYALSGTQFFGVLSLAARVMFKEGNTAGTGDGQLYVIESNYTRRPTSWLAEHTGVELAVTYLNLFKATSGWQPIAGGNFDRLRNLFVLNPLIAIAAGRAPSDTYGLALGTQLFRCHEDESFIPEFAIERPTGHTVWGIGLRYQRKLTARCYLDLRGVKTWSSQSQLVREGVFVSTFVIF